MHKNRRAFLGAIGAAATTGLAGCTGVSTDVAAMAGLARPESRESWSTIDDSVAVTGQPTIEDGVPKTWGTIARTPEEADALIDWNAIRHTTHEKDMTPASFKDFLGDAEGHFVTAIVGVLPGDESLKGTQDGGTSFEGNVMRSEVTSYQAIVPADTASENTTADEDEDSPQYHYAYSFGLWARNGAQTPDTLEVTYIE